MRMPELKAFTREHGLRNYSQLRKAELIAFLQNNENRAQRPPLSPPQMSLSGVTPRGVTWEPNRPPQMSTWEPNRPPQRRAPPTSWMSTWEPECAPQQPEIEAPLTKSTT